MKKFSILILAAAMLAGTSLQAQENKAKPVVKPEAKPMVVPAKANENAAQPAANQNPNAAEIKFETDEHNFGAIKQGEVVDYEFKFTNTGKEPLIITNASGSCGCTVPEWPKDPIRPGAGGTIKVSFNSAGKQGQQSKTVTITSNAKNSPKIITVKGVIIAAAEPAKTEPAKK